VSQWKPESFSDYHKRMKDDPEGASNALDFTFQTIATKTNNNETGIAALQPTGGITKNRPSNPPLYTPYWDVSLNKAVYFQGRGVWKDALGVVS
jgi:hypothetical protein